MDPSDLLREVASVLERMDLRYFVTGSFASTVHGEARLTNGVDIVLLLPLHRVEELCGSFPEADYCVSVDAPRQAATLGGQFKIVHPASGFQADLIVADNSLPRRNRFHRASRKRIGDAGPEFVLSSAKDVILEKLEFRREGGTDKHLRDIAGIIKVQAERLDRTSIEQWARELDGLDLWQAIVARVEQR
jgi:hypothetical protein